MYAMLYNSSTYLKWSKRSSYKTEQVFSTTREKEGLFMERAAETGGKTFRFNAKCKLRRKSIFRVTFENHKRYTFSSEFSTQRNSTANGSNNGIYHATIRAGQRGKHEIRKTYPLLIFRSSSSSDIHK